MIIDAKMLSHRGKSVPQQTNTNCPVMTCVIYTDYLLFMDREQLKELRVTFGLSQERLARLVGVSVRSVARWEAGHTAPSPLAERQLNALERLKRELDLLMRPDSINEWMARPQSKLGGRSPLQVLLSEGPEPVLRLLEEVSSVLEP